MFLMRPAGLQVHLKKLANLKKRNPYKSNAQTYLSDVQIVNKRKSKYGFLLAQG